MPKPEANCDFETKSGADIKLGLEVYFHDPEADLLCLSYRLPGQPIKRWVAGGPAPGDLFAHVAAGLKIRAWNAIFEWMAWNILGAKYGWPSLPLEAMTDTMAEAQAMNLPGSLEKCGVVLGLPADKQKSHEGKQLIRKLCVPQKPTKNQPLRWLTPATHWALHENLWAYCDQDVVAEESIAAKLRRLSPVEQRTWVLTQQINQRGIPIAIDEARSIDAVVTAEKDRLNRELRKITSRQVLAATNRGAMLAWVNAHPSLKQQPVLFEDEDDELVEDHHGDYVVDMTKATVATVLLRSDLPPDVRRVLEIRQQVVQTSTAKYPKLLKIAPDGLLRNMHVYHGANTGRWASRGGFNTQNLPRTTMGKSDIAVAHAALGGMSYDACALLFGDDLMKAAVNCLRGVIKAPAGFDLLNVDYKSVENVVASWLAGQHDKLEMFREGRFDEYKLFAAKLFGVAYEDVTPEQRQMCKPIILGGIFGLGAHGLGEYAQQYGVRIQYHEAVDYIKVLRSDYWAVRKCWYACQNAMIAAVQEPGTWQAAGDKLSFIVYKRFLWLKLPSGRPIAWANPSVSMEEVPWNENVRVGEDAEGAPVYEERPAQRMTVFVESVDTITRQWCEHKLIGSSAFQSGVQATARDILANGIANADEAGYDTRMLVHDSALALVPAGQGSPEDYGNLLIKPAPWFHDLPLKFEAWRGPRFTK